MMFENNFNNRFVKIKVIGVNTKENNSGGLTALNFMLKQNFSGVNYLAIDRHDVKNLKSCNTIHKFRLLTSNDEKILTENLRGTDFIFIIADDVWENIKLVALTAHCAKKSGSTVIFIAGGNFEDAEDEIIFDALIKLPNKNFELDSCKVIKNFIEIATLPGQPKLDVNFIADFLKNSAAIVAYSERDGKNAALKAVKAALGHAEISSDDFKTANKIFFNVTAAKANFLLEEAQKISKLLKRHAPKAEIAFGFSMDNYLVDKVKILIVAT